MLSFSIGVQVFFLVFVRVLGVFVSSPFWNSPILFFRFRLTLVLLFSYTLLPLAEQTVSASAPLSVGVFWPAILLNLLIGLLMGFSIYLMFSIFQMVGELWSFQMGFSLSQVLDPSTGEQSAILSQMVNFLALLVFMAVGGHLKILSLIFESLTVHPLLLQENFQYSSMLMSLAKGMTALFWNALELSMTIVGSIFIATLVVGLLAKAAPQLNVFQFGMPVYVMIGFALMVYLLPNFIAYTGNYIDTIFLLVREWMLSPKGGVA